MFGSEKALLGGKQSTGDAFEAMDTAIATLKAKSFECFKFFLTQLVLFHLSSLLLMWILYDFIVALVVNVTMGFFLALFVQNA